MSKQKIQLSDHFDYSRLIRFVLPCIGTMLFTSIYGIVDGLCVSNFVGKTAFAAVNLIMPVPMLVGSVGFMLGTGGSAIVGITLGEGDREKADRYFSLFVWAALLAGIVLAAVGVLIVRPAAALLAGNEKLRELFIKGKRKGRLEPAELSEVVDPLDLDGDQMDRIYDSLADLGIEKSGLDRLIQCSYDLLGLISFLTYGKDECRAWTIKKGTKAPQAAGKIHSDIERGFIRAETINFSEMIACGSVAAAKEKGLLRSEGKDYVVKDGDMIYFRFNV